MHACVKKIIWISSSLMLLACGGSGSGNSNATTSRAVVSTSVASVSSRSASTISAAPNSSMSASAQSSRGESSAAQVAGIATRPVNKTCLAPAPVSSGATTINWSPAFPALPTIQQATSLLQAPGDDSAWYALRQSGRVVRFANDVAANQLETVLNIEDRVNFRDSETGLLGIAFHPQFATNRYVYLYYMGLNADNKLESRISRFQFSAIEIDKNSELILLRFDQPFSNHNAGQLSFGPDGYLYISSGDGGNGGDPQENGQNKNNLLGKMLRIDVDSAASGKNYGIPADNPFASGGGSPEIWAYGLRNPWRFSFDKETGDLWVGDVGQSAWEEINIVTRGGNYGWGDMEGERCYSGRPNCVMENKITPVLSISHNTGVCSVIGGYVYRGKKYPDVYGNYFFTDYCVNTMQSITRNNDQTIIVNSHGNVPLDIVSFAQDNSGELYAIGQSGADSQIVKLEASGGEVIPGAMAQRLSATGCVDAGDPTQPASAMIPYDVESQLWSDSAEKDRFFALPDDKKIALDSAGDFLFPVGSVLMKHFKFGDKFLETRLFTYSETGWQGFSYEWRDDQTDAMLLADAKEKNIEGIQWQYPSPAQCLTCHTEAANFSLGLETKQLNAAMEYPKGVVANQLNTLAHIQLFSSPLTAEQKTTKLFELTDSTATVEQRARSYLHSNCAGCHLPDGPAPTNLDLRFATTLPATNACDIQPGSGDLGIANARIIAPGEPDRSVLLARMKVRDENQMPPLASHLVDDAAVTLITEWIANLEGCK